MFPRTAIYTASAWPRKEFLKVTLPSLLTIVFFVGAIFVVALPIFKRNLLEEKKQTLAAVTTVAGDILTYIRDHSEAEFTYSICPDCTKKLYPNLKISNRGQDQS